MTGEAPLASSAFRDDFDGSLDPGWSWYQNDAPGWTLSNMPGWLRLNLSAGSFFGATPPANLLVRPAPPGDFDLKTWLRFTPIRNFELAGLVVVFDDDSVLQLGRGFCEVPGGSAECVGDGLYFDNIQDGSPVGGNFAAPSLLGVDYLLRLQRQGNGYSASYSTDGSTWAPLGSHTVDKAPVSIGLIAAQAGTPGNYADFDYFEMSSP
jgi:beta-xylosidase